LQPSAIVARITDPDKLETAKCLAVNLADHFPINAPGHEVVLD
jgi:hypothetical protein